MRHLAPCVHAGLLASAALSAFPAAGAAQGARGSSPDWDPPLSAYVDSAGLLRAVAALRVPELPPGSTPIFHVTFDSAGAVTHLGASHRVPDGYAPPVLAAIRPYLRPLSPAPGRIVNTELWVVAGPRAEVRRYTPTLAGSLEEAPKILNREAVCQELRALMREFGNRDPREVLLFAAEMRVLVLSSGAVDSTRMNVVVSSGDDELDRRALLVMRQMRFSPGRAGGRVVRVWIPVAVSHIVPFNRPDCHMPTPRDRPSPTAGEPNGT